MPLDSEYSGKLKTAEEALRQVHSGMRIFVHASSGYPYALVDALAGRSAQLRNVEICHLLTYNHLSTSEAQYASSFRHTCWFIGGHMRDPVAEGRADYVPIHLGQVEQLALRRPMDVALIQVSPPDEHGFVSLGAAVEVTAAFARSARHVIAQVNSCTPWTCGESQLHISEIDVFVEHAQPLAEFSLHEPTESERMIARHIAPLIEDGATFQIGIGGVPDAVLSQLMDRRDLGVHTEIVSDSMIPLIEAGVVTCARKTLHPRKLVIGFGLGTRRLYEYVDRNPFFEFRPNSYVNDPFVIAQNDGIVAINSALQVDLTGQVCSDSFGQHFYSGFGGQVDFIRGAGRAKQGRPVIALPATAKNGTISRIVPTLENGGGVVTTRADVHYVATEFGQVDLYGKSVRERAQLLISIAHPSFREELFEHCMRARWFQRNQAGGLAQGIAAGVSS